MSVIPVCATNQEQITSCLLLLLNQSGAESCHLVSSLSLASLICIKLCIQYLVISRKHLKMNKVVLERLTRR